MLALGKRACQLWGWGTADVVLVAQRENTTFKISLSADTHFALRLHRLGYRSHLQLEAELKWMQYLRGQGLAVPAPVESVQSHLLEHIEGYQVSVLQWFDGQAMGESGQPLALKKGPQTFYSLGQAMARLHQTSDAWSGVEGLDRPRWDIEGLLGEQPLWGPFWKNSQLNDEQATLLLAAKDRLKIDLQQWLPRLDFGLIHADLVRENVLLLGTQPQLIDFDDSGFGFRLFELATCLLANTNEPNYDELKTQLIAGYQSVRSLDVAQLDAFMLVRALTYVGWIMPRMDEEGGHRRCQRFSQRALNLSQQYLNPD